METASAAMLDSKWPPDPYKGLTYYGPEDTPLFAGRRPDVQRFARILGSGRTRILLLHGATGCGKSSFLRAGLIPYLEDEIGRFSFGKDLVEKLSAPESGSREAMLFVRSTYDPLLELAIRTYSYARMVQRDLDQEHIRVGFSSQPVVLNSEPCPLLDKKLYPTPADFCKAVADDPRAIAFGF